MIYKLKLSSKSCLSSLRCCILLPVAGEAAVARPTYLANKNYFIH